MPTSVKILSIETATRICSVAVHRDGVLIGSSEIREENGHSAKLLKLIVSLLEGIDCTIDHIGAVAVSSGPGSYTGLRIGVSVAKGICFAKSIPLIGIDTLEALAYDAVKCAVNGSAVVPMMDARRNEVYVSVIAAGGGVLWPSQPLVVDSNPFLDLLAQNKVYFLGDGVKKLKHILNHPNALYLEELNSATRIGELAYEKYLDGSYVDLAYFEPNYLKDFRVIPSRKNPLKV